MTSNFDKMTASAERDISALLTFIDKALELSGPILEKIGRFDQERISKEEFGFMAWSFLLKQREHLQSIKVLVGKRDASLVARSMIEGICQLFWALRDKQTRAAMWKNFVYVHDMRLLKVKEENGVLIDEEQRETITKGLSVHGSDFFRSEKFKTRSPGDLPQDPYRFDWTGEKVIDICKDVGEEVLYSEFYSPYSDWHHWNFGGIGLSMKDTEGGIEYLTNAPVVYLTAVQVGIRCFVDTIRVIDWHFKFDFAKSVKEFLDDYRKWCEERGYN